MQKIINFSMLILICAGIIFGTWSDRVILDYIDKGLNPPQDMLCYKDRIEYFLGGIIGIWAGINLFYRPAFIPKMFGRVVSPVEIFFTRCFGLLLVCASFLSFWNIYISNLPRCKIL